MPSRGDLDKQAPAATTPSAGEEARPRGPNGQRAVLGAGPAPPSEPATAASRTPWRSYKEQVASISERIVEAQRPIRVLQALRWDPAVEEAFRRTRFRELPRVGPDEYARTDLGFDPRAKQEELERLVADCDRVLGARDAVGRILHETAEGYRDVVRMLAARGTPDFHAWSRRLYGSPKDAFPDGRTTVRDLGHALYEVLAGVAGRDLGADPAAGSGTFARDIGAEEAAEILNRRFAAYFDRKVVTVVVDDSILADAAAGSDYVKIRSGARFSPRDLDVLEVHEGWVHVATSLNGQAQPVARWLAKGPPRTTAAQEGLAALLEILTLRSHPRRARRLNDRLLAVDKAEDGADFLEVFEWYRTEGYDEDECFAAARRVFRGGVVSGGAPFTKDACYCKGIVLNYAFLRAAVEHNRPDLVRFLFVGKVAHEDVPVLCARAESGLVRPPQYLPPMFRDMNGLAIWLAYSSFFTRLGGPEISAHYARIFGPCDG